LGTSTYSPEERHAPGPLSTSSQTQETSAQTGTPTRTQSSSASVAGETSSESGDNEVWQMQYAVNEKFLACSQRTLVAIPYLIQLRNSRIFLGLGHFASRIIFKIFCLKKKKKTPLKFKKNLR